MKASVTGASAFIPADPEVSPQDPRLHPTGLHPQLTTGGPLRIEQLPVKRTNALADGNLKTRSSRLTGDWER